MKRVLFTALALLIPIGGIILDASPASAHDDSRGLVWGGAYRGYGGVKSNHYRVYACDTRADGFGIKTDFKVSGVGGTYSVVDPNGSASGCGDIDPGEPGRITWFRVCITNADGYCTGWVQA